MADRFIYKHRRGTTEQWATSDSIIYDGEIVVEKPNDGYIRLKVGDGTKKFSELPYMNIPMDSFPKELLKITVTSSDSTYSADKTDSDIKSCLDNGGIPYIALYDTVFIYEGYSSDIGYMFIDTNDGKMLCIYKNRVSLYSSNLKSKLDSTVSTTAQTLTDKQKTQARTNIGATDISLGLTGSSAGQIIKIKSVDESGVPTEWTSTNMPSGGGADISLGISGATAGQVAKVKSVDESGAPTEWKAEKDTTPFIVTVGGESSGYTSSHTFDEIAAAASAGRVVMAYSDYINFPQVRQSLYGVYFYLISTQDEALFRYTDGLLEYYVTVNPFGTSAGAEYLSATSSSFGGVKADSAEATDTQPVRIGDDGKLYTAPGGGGGADISLGISGATAGQVAKVKSVDASGAPTAWEAGDAPIGGGASEWTLFQEGITDADVSGFEFDGVGDYTEFLFLGSWVKGSGKAGLSVKMNDAYALTVGNYFVHDGQAKNVSVELIFMERKRFSLRGLSQQQNSTQYNIDELGTQSIYNIPQGIETPITKISFYSSNTNVQIPAGATYALYVR